MQLQKHARDRSTSVRRLVMMFVLLCLVPLAALAVSSVRLASDALRTEVEGRMASAAQLTAVAVQGELDGVSDLVESYAERPSLRKTLSGGAPSGAELAFQLRGLRQARPGLDAAFIASPEGRMLAVSPRTDAAIGQDFSHRDWYEGVTATGRTYVSEAFVGQGAGSPVVVAITTIVRDAGRRPLAILGTVYPLGSLHSFVSNFADSQDVSLTLTDRRGTLLARPGIARAKLVSQRGDMAVAAALRGEAGVVTSQGRLVAYRPIAGLGWTVSASVPEDRAFAAVGRLRASVLGATGVLALILLAGLALLIRSLRQRRHAEDDAEQARAENERLAAIVAGSDDAILSKTLDGVITSWNAGAERLYGYTADEAVGQPIALLIPEDSKGEERDILKHVMAGGRLENHESRRRTKDGTVIDVALTISPIRDAEGRVVGVSTIARDITERRRAEEEARAARAEAERANQAKSKFLSRMSHELRTPMNAVLGFAQLLELGEIDEQQRESVGQILRAGNHLLALINEVLDVARIEAGKLTLSLEPVDADEALSEAVELIRPLAVDRGIAISVEGGTDACVRADRQRLKQILLNLLSNAVKYNRDDGLVEVSLEQRSDERLRIAVSDTGPGLTPEQLDRLFAPFERLGADAGQVEGTGLGLTLSKGLAEAMGGEMGVESRPGDGSTFWVELDTIESSPTRVDRLEERVGSHPHAVGHAGSVLYIEDNLSNLKLVEHVFTRFPHIELLAAMQGTLGLELAREHRPDLILLDLHLPDMDGEVVLARLRAAPETASVPVVVLSADATPRRIERLRAAGVDDYLPKPLDIARFMALLRHHLPEYEATAVQGGRAG